MIGSTRRRHWWRIGPLVVAGAVLLSACSIGGAGGSTDGDAERDRTGSELGSQPAEGLPTTDSELSDRIAASTFVEGVCGFQAPQGSEPLCGSVKVPMDWATGDGEIELAVAVFAGTATDAGADPVVYLEGGPGGHALETIRFTEADLLEPLRSRGDVILFDQRGAGLSQPRLSCPEVDEVTRELEDSPGLEVGEADDLFHGALTGCRERLRADGVDLGSFTSINNAHDVEAIRVALSGELGFEQWNLFGVSYGTKLGLEVLRQHPDGVRSVVLDSVFPPQVDSALENPSSFVASYEAVVAACAAEPECSAHGDLGERLAAVVQRYEDEPVQVEVTDLLTGTVDEIYLEGETIIGIVSQALYTPLWFTDLPELVAELETGRFGAVETFLSQQRTNEPFFTSGMFYAIECNEEVPFAEPEAVAAAVPPDPFGLRDGFNYASNSGPNAFGTCDAFGSTAAAALSNEPVASDVPTLLLAGRFDPVTPVAWAEAAAETLSNSHLVVDPFHSHGVATEPCGISIVLDFLADPKAEPATSCLDDGSVRFLAPPDGSVTLETVTLSTTATGVEGTPVTIVRPENWTHGTLGGDSYRQASFLDPTQLIQVADQPLLRIGLESYLSQSFDVLLAGSVARPELGGRNWKQRSGRSDDVAVEWFETEIDGAEVFVILVSTTDELAANIDAVLMPAIEAIAVG